jgi:hypothetical protein
MNGGTKYLAIYFSFCRPAPMNGGCLPNSFKLSTYLAYLWYGVENFPNNWTTYDCVAMSEPNNMQDISVSLNS